MFVCTSVCLRVHVHKHTHEKRGEEGRGEKRKGGERRGGEGSDSSH